MATRIQPSVLVENRLLAADPGTELRRNLLTYLSAIVPASAFDLINTTVDEISQKTQRR